MISLYAITALCVFAFLAGHVWSDPYAGWRQWAGVFGLALAWPAVVVAWVVSWAARRVRR